MRVLLIIIFLIIVSYAQQDSLQTVGVSKIIRVYDGDTFYANLYNLPDIFGKNLGIRLTGIDTPELNSPDSCSRAKAKQAKNYLVERFKNACKIELRQITRDKYFRIDAIVYLDGVNINQEMIDKGHARPYTGEGSKPTFTCSN